MNRACITSDHSHDSCTGGRAQHECASTANVNEKSGPRPLPVPSTAVLRPCTDGREARDESDSLERRGGDRFRSAG
jgi:hypothetical protein